MLPTLTENEPGTLDPAVPMLLPPPPPPPYMDVMVIIAEMGEAYNALLVMGSVHGTHVDALKLADSVSGFAGIVNVHGSELLAHVPVQLPNTLFVNGVAVTVICVPAG